MNKRKKIVIAEPSIIIRSGLTAIIKRFSSINCDVYEIDNIELVRNYLKENSCDILIINPQYFSIISPQKIKSESKTNDIKLLGLKIGAIENSISKYFDSTISIYDTTNSIQDKLELLTANNDEEDKSSLSERENEVLSYIARGYSNKEIADKLFLSTHTVMAHRRNIISKLQIHSSAGLTIYAISNNLIEISDIDKLI